LLQAIMCILIELFKCTLFILGTKKPATKAGPIKLTLKSISY